MDIICFGSAGATCLWREIPMWIQASRVPAAMSVPVPEMVSSVEAANKCSLVVIGVLLRFPNNSFEINNREKTAVKKAPRPTHTQGIEPCATSPVSLNPLTETG